MLFLSFKLQNGMLINPLPFFYVELGLVCTEAYRFVEFTSKKCINNFVQSAVVSRRRSGENPNSIVVAKRHKLKVNSSYGYQVMDRSPHTETKYSNDQNMLIAINLYLPDLSNKTSTGKQSIVRGGAWKSGSRTQKTVFIEFFNIHCTKLQMLVFYEIFFDKFCDIYNFEEVEVDTGFSLTSAFGNGTDYLYST